MSEKSSGQLTRLLRRLREHGLLKRVRNCYRYYLTDFGRQVAMMALKLREMVIIPSLALDVV
jgi:DNA-binding HxlR family transcriptional regulator